MQKQPRDAYNLWYLPISLDDRFPIDGGGHHLQGDRPITDLHVHDCLELGYCHAGSGIFVVEDKVFSFNAGDVVIINEKEMHLAQSVHRTTSHWSWIYLDPVMLAGTCSDEPKLLETGFLCGSSFRNILSRKDHPEIVELIRELQSELEAKKAGYTSAVRGLVLTLMVRLHRLAGTRSGSEDESGYARIGRVAPSLEYMAGNLGRPIKIGDLAKMCNLSVTHFRRLFLKAVGKSPLQYLIALRVQMAATQLRSTDRTVLDISMESGYTTLSSFNRHFRMITGMSPRELRKAGC